MVTPTAVARRAGPALGVARSQGMEPSSRTDNVEAREQDVDLSPDERRDVEEREVASALVTHEVIRRHGDEEMERPALSLAWSGLAGGVAISASIMGQALIADTLPSAPWADAVASIGYTVGFLIVILGRMQLFTESTLSAVIPVATHPTLQNFTRLGRFWIIVLAANLVGTFLVALMVEGGVVGEPSLRLAMLELSRHLLERDPLQLIAMGIPAGFLMAAIPWALPSARGQEFLVIVFITWFIALGKFAHVVAGSGEAWLLVLAGDASLGYAIGGIILPALLGNIIGGTGLFALLAHAQVRQEL